MDLRSQRQTMHARLRAMGMRLGEPVFGPAYGLTIHEARRFVYVRVPKVATHSMAAWLAGTFIPPPTWHRRAFLPRDLTDWYVFSVVRNPWDRVAASWREKAPGSTNPAPFYAPWADRPFPEFVAHLANLDLDTVEEHVRRQSALVPLDAMSFVARLEEIATDIETIAGTLGVSTKALQTLNRAPSSVRGDYRDLYDDASRELVGELYADEIERFAYTFDGPVPRHG